VKCIKVVQTSSQILLRFATSEIATYSYRQLVTIQHQDGDPKLKVSILRPISLAIQHQREIEGELDTLTQAPKEETILKAVMIMVVVNSVSPIRIAVKPRMFRRIVASLIKFSRPARDVILFQNETAVDTDSLVYSYLLR
jgi:hypothetical protein